MALTHNDASLEEGNSDTGPTRRVILPHAGDTRHGQQLQKLDKAARASEGAGWPTPQFPVPPATPAPGRELVSEPWNQLGVHRPLVMVAAGHSLRVTGV